MYQLYVNNAALKKKKKDFQKVSGGTNQEERDSRSGKLKDWGTFKGLTAAADHM